MRWLGMLLLTPLAAASGPAPASMDQLALRFLETLPDRSVAAKPFDDPERENWHFVPKSRFGATWKSMAPAQSEAAKALLKAALSGAGWTRVEAIRQLEEDLHKLEGGNAIRDPGLYTFAVFGTPGPRGTWGWRYEGHHLSLNYTYRDGKLVSSTPQFLGANPANTSDGRRALGDLEDLGRRLITSLSPAQRNVAVIGDVAPADIITSAARKASILEDRGVAYSDLNSDQKRVLMDLLEAYAGVQNRAERDRRLAAIRKSGLEGVKFAWMGGLRPGQGHYYRIQGATFLIEYDNTQNSANHIHTVWRDFEDDFGRDLLADHYRHGHHAH